MNSKNVLMSIGATVLAIGLAMPASALSVQGLVDGGADMSSDLTNAISVGGTADVSAEGGANSTTSGASAGAGVSGTSGSSSSGFSASIKSVLSNLVNGSVSDGNEEQRSTGTVAIDVRDATILVTRADIENGNAVVTSDAVLSVTNDADLKGFIAAHVQNDANVESIEYASDSISVTYKERAKLFAVLPVDVEATVTVDADGTVDVSYPWYSFLMTTNKEAIEAKVEQRVQAAFNTVADVSADARTAAAIQGSLDTQTGSTDPGAAAAAEVAATLTAQAQARLIAEIKGAMKDALEEAQTRTDAELEARIDVETSGSVDAR